jgi:hypothetical protein
MQALLAKNGRLGSPDSDRDKQLQRLSCCQLHHSPVNCRDGETKVADPHDRRGTSLTLMALAYGPVYAQLDESVAGVSGMHSVSRDTSHPAVEIENR